MMKDRMYPRRGLHGEVVHELGVRILRGELRPGDPLPIDLDASQAGVSRTVVRETIKVLAAKGLVVSRPKTGTQVRERQFWNLLDPDVLAWRLEADPGDGFFVDVFEARRVIEPAVAAMAAARASKAQVAELETVFARMEETAGTDPHEHLAADLRFHEIILEGCGNELLAQVGTTLRAVFRASFERTSEAQQHTLELHAAVLEGVREGDGARATTAMLELIELSASFLGQRTGVAAD